MSSWAGRCENRSVVACEGGITSGCTGAGATGRSSFVQWMCAGPVNLALDRGSENREHANEAIGRG